MARSVAIRALDNHIHYTMQQYAKMENKTLSYATRNERIARLKKIGRDLHEKGFKVRKITSLQARHVTVLVDTWKERGLSAGRIKNLMTDIRFIYERANDGRKLPDNDYFGIEKRSYVSNENHAIKDISFEHIEHPFLRCSLELQRAFGLRREECLKIVPKLADKEKRLWLKDTWTKGKVERYIPIRTEEQRFWLEVAKAITKGKSLIPQDKSYIEHRKKYDSTVQNNGWKKMHGLRYNYAQSRYEELTGMKCPFNGGLKRKEMTEEQKEKDRIAKIIVSQELGHSRPEIVQTYIGR